MIHQLPVILFLLPLFAAISLPVVCLKHCHWSRPISIAVLSAMVPASILNLHNVILHGEIRYVFGGWTVPLGIEWVADGLASIILVLLSSLSLLGVVFAGPTSPKGSGRSNRPLLHFDFVIDICHYRSCFRCGFIQSVRVFRSCSHRKLRTYWSSWRKSACLQPFAILYWEPLGASLYLLGVSYLYAVSGTLNMSDMVERLPQIVHSKALVGGLLFMFIGLGIKMALVPFHAWMPEAYTYAPDSISPILASLVTKVALLAWVRIIYWVFNASMVIFDIPFCYWWKLLEHWRRS